MKPNVTRNFVLFNCIFNLFFTSKLLQCFPCFVTNLGVQKFANQNMFCFSKRRRHNLITSVVSRSDSETISFCAFKNYTKFYLILLFAIKFSNVLHKNQVQFPCQRLFWLLIMLYIFRWQAGWPAHGSAWWWLSSCSSFSSLALARGENS